MRKYLDICVISDTHLGTSGCRAEELLQYLRQVEPARLILNGDIIDAWQFRKSYFPPAHWAVIERILELANTGTIVYYLTGNHDNILRRFDHLDLGNIRLRHQLELRVQGRLYWFFHGDVFDASVLFAPWIAKLGGKGYDWLIRVNAWINRWRSRFGLPRISFAHRVKKSVKRAVRFIQDFEKMAIQMGVRKNADAVICGHIHQPVIRQVRTEEGEIVYMNAGDWVEHLTALECVSGRWSLYRHKENLGDEQLAAYLSQLEANQYVFPQPAHLRRGASEK